VVASAWVSIPDEILSGSFPTVLSQHPARIRLGTERLSTNNWKNKPAVRFEIPTQGTSTIPNGKEG